MTSLWQYKNRMKIFQVFSRRTVAKPEWGGWNRRICSFSHCYTLSFRNKVDIIVHYNCTTTPSSGFLFTPIRMTRMPDSLVCLQ